MSQMCKKLSQFAVLAQRSRLLCVGRAALLGLVFTAFAAFSAEEPKPSLADLSLDDLMNVEVVGASKFEQKAKEAPSSITVLTADDFKKARLSHAGRSAAKRAGLSRFV
jgi:hypothetical protein